MTITHDGGDTIDADDLTVTGSSSDAISVATADDISAGDKLVDAQTVTSGETIRVVYNDPNNDKSAVLATSVAP
ncbi:hypothetical protein ACFQH8_11600 [Halomicroarcula sp. GCM10025710]